MLAARFLVSGTHQSNKGGFASTTRTEQDKRRYYNSGALAVQEQVEDDGQRQRQQQGEEHGSDGRAEAPGEPFPCGVHVDGHGRLCMNGRGQVVVRAIDDSKVGRSRCCLSTLRPEHSACRNLGHLRLSSNISESLPLRSELDFVTDCDSVTRRAMVSVASKTRSYSIQQRAFKGYDCRHTSCMPFCCAVKHFRHLMLLDKGETRPSAQ